MTRDDFSVRGQPREERSRSTVIDQVFAIFARHAAVGSSGKRERAIVVVTGSLNRQKQWTNKAEVAVDVCRQPRATFADCKPVYEVSSSQIRLLQRQHDKLGAGHDLLDAG